MVNFKKECLDVKIMPTRAEMGTVAAADVVACIKKLLAEKDEVNMIFAAAPSQNEVLAGLVASDVDWSRVNAFHMDEYIGLPAGAPQCFSNFLKAAIFEKLPFKSVNCIDASATDAAAECKRYGDLLNAYPTDIVVMGIGENGHIAFNDPHVADLHDPKLVKKVSLDEVCRMQQVHDGCFEKLDDVPNYALTLTVPALAKADYHFCVVPAASKANAVRETVYGPIGEKCPATSLRTCDHAILYIDNDSGKLL